MKYYLVIFLFIIAFAGFSQQPGYNLQFKIEGLKDTTIMIGFYYGEATRLSIMDTATINSHGEFIFEGEESLPKGEYSLLIKETRVLDLLIGDDQQFKLETSIDDYLKKMKVTGDLDNTILFESRLFDLEAEPLVKIIQDSTSKEINKKKAQESLEKLNQKVLAYRVKTVADHPEAIISKIFNITLPLVPPKTLERADGSIDSTRLLKWYQQHFFDNFNLADESLIRLQHPYYKEKIDEYLDQLFTQQADTLIKAIDWLAGKTKKNQPTYRYLILHLIQKYQDPKFMGLDKLFVHLNDNYFANGEMDFWANWAMRKNMKDIADRLRNSLVGMEAPSLIMKDANLELRSLYDIQKKFTILFFFSPDCNYCRVETYKLLSFYTTNKDTFNLEVYAVDTDTSMNKMRDFIRQANMKWVTVNGFRSTVGDFHDLYDAAITPTLYVLDEKKRIIGKKVPVEKLEEFLSNYEKSAVQQSKN